MCAGLKNTGNMTLLLAAQDNPALGVWLILHNGRNIIAPYYAKRDHSTYNFGHK